MSQSIQSGAFHSDSTKPFYYFAVGVLKIDYRTAGYAEIRKVAQEWAQHKEFKQIIVRKVSQDNYGIQFVYMSYDPLCPRIKMFRESLKEKFGDGLYAHDYQESSGDEGTDRIRDQVIVDSVIFE
ncbi:MAG: hypothetical protein ACK4NC_03145 [Candidatus Gracilibacteria bacterium]